MAVQTHRGPDKGDGCLLDEKQQQAIQRLICDHRPDELDLPFALWSRVAVSALIKRECGKMLPVRTMAGQF